MTREQIAAELFKGKLDIAFASDDRQIEAITSALAFADLFLDIANDKNHNFDTAEDKQEYNDIWKNQ